MKIEVLYFEGCPNHEPAVARVDEIVKAEGISAEVSEVNVPDASTAHEVGFLGSPSIRVNGMDVEQAARSAREYGMMCRTYVVNGRREGLPSREMIQQAIREVQSGVPSADQVRECVAIRCGVGPCRNRGELLLRSSNRLCADGLFDSWRVGIVRRVETLSAWPDLWTSGFGFLLRISAARGAVRARLRLRDACDEPVGAPHAVACDCCGHSVCRLSILLGPCSRIAAPWRLFCGGCPE